MRRVPAPDPRCTLTARVLTTHEGHWTNADGTRGADYISRTLLVEVDGGPTLDGVPQFGPADSSFPPWPCGSCDTWECNASPKYATWVRRSGSCVIWLDKNDECHVFDGDHYEAALRLPGAETEAWTTLELLGFIDDEHDDTSRFTLWLDRDRVHERSEELQIAVDTALEIPELDAVPFELTAPPADDAVTIDDAGYFAHDGSRWIAYLPGLFGLPSWFASPVVDVMAGALGLPATAADS